MQTENRRLRFLHQLLANIDRLIYLSNEVDDKVGNMPVAPMLQMTVAADTESLLRCFGKIMAAGTMRHAYDKSRYDCHSSLHQSLLHR